MDISTELIKQLRLETGAGMLDVKKALQESDGDPIKAVEILRKKGLMARAKKAERAAKEGLIDSYIHAGGKIGVMLEINCETDFVARTDDFKNLAREISLHIAAAAPLYGDIDEIREETLAKEREIAMEQARAEGKPENVVEKIVEGRLKKYYEETVLLDQPYVKNPEQTIGDLLAEYVGRLGENIQIKRFARYVLGQE